MDQLSFKVVLDVQSNRKEEEAVSLSVSQPQISINELCEATSIKKEDVISTLQVCSKYFWGMWGRGGGHSRLFQKRLCKN